MKKIILVLVVATAGFLFNFEEVSRLVTTFGNTVREAVIYGVTAIAGSRN